MYEEPTAINQFYSWFWTSSDDIYNNIYFFFLYFSFCFFPILSINFNHIAFFSDFSITWHHWETIKLIYLGDYTQAKSAKWKKLTKWWKNSKQFVIGKPQSKTVSSVIHYFVRRELRIRNENFQHLGRVCTWTKFAALRKFCPLNFNIFVLNLWHFRSHVKNWFTITRG